MTLPTPWSDPFIHATRRRNCNVHARNPAAAHQTWRCWSACHRSLDIPSTMRTERSGLVTAWRAMKARMTHSDTHMPA